MEHFACQPTAALAPRAVLDLALLAVASARPRSQRGLAVAVRQIGGRRFQPTVDVIAGRVEALVAAGLLVTVPDCGAEPLWQPSPAGRAHMQRLLLTRSEPPVDALAGLCACLKICCLELLDGEARRAVLDDLLAAHRRALRDAEAALAGCPCRCALVERCLAREVERWHTELGWLEALSGAIDARITA